METDARLHRALADPSRARILETLRTSEEPRDASQLADTVGLHVNTVRSHLRVLARAGLVSVRPEERHTRGRPRLVFEPAARPGTPRVQGGYQLLAEILASELAGSGDDSADRARQAGEAWGRFLVSRRPPHVPSSAAEDIDAVLALLEEAGFDPALDENSPGHTVLMQHCPFGEVADHYRKIVCAVHLGLIQGALDELGAHARADRLVPFVRPGVCAAHLARNAIAAVPGEGGAVSRIGAEAPIS